MGLSQIQFQKNKFNQWFAENSIKASELSIQHENGTYIEIDKYNGKLKCWTGGHAQRF